MSPISCSDEFVVITDGGTGVIDIWILRDRSSSVNAVAKMDHVDGGYCDNTVRYL